MVHCGLTFRATHPNPQLLKILERVAPAICQMSEEALVLRANGPRGAESSRNGGLYDWLKYEDNGMFCKHCQEARKKGPFSGTTGCTNYRTSTLTRHARSKEHRDAVRERVMRKEMASATQRAISQNEMAVISAFRVVYWLAKEEVASSKFPSLITLLKLSGVQCLESLHVGANATYMHHDSLTQMQDAIDQCLQDTTVEKLRACDAYGLIVEESTDVAITKKPCSLC